MQQKLEISITSAIDNITDVENFIEQMFERLMTRDDYPSKRLGQISLPIIEAVVNGVVAGNKNDTTKKITVLAERIGNKLKVTVSDEGKGFDYAIIPNPTSHQNLEKECGRGLYIMKVLTDDDLIFENNGATVIMTFDL